jgi:GT2 family glycosyltransferase
MTIYIGVVTYNSEADLPACFEGLRHQDAAEIEIRVWDNASSDGTVEWLQKHAGDIPLIESDENLGFGRGHNRLLDAIKLEPGDYYLTLNPDVCLEPQYISELVEAVEEHDAGWGTGKLLQMDEAGEPTGRIYSVGHAILRDGYFFNIGYGMEDEGQFEHGREVFGAPGAAALYSAELIEAISYEGEFFDEQIFMYGEDTDVDWRARNQGWRCWYAPGAVAYHRGSSPEEVLRAEAILSRYRSVIKNAKLPSLLMVNVPIMNVHLFLRLILSPPAGLLMIKRWFSQLPDVIKRRGAVKFRVANMVKWLAWSQAQPSEQPKGWFARLSSFFG